MSENNGWTPMTQEELDRRKAMPTQEFYVGASGIDLQPPKVQLKDLSKLQMQCNHMMPQNIYEPYLKMMAVHIHHWTLTKNLI